MRKKHLLVPINFDQESRVALEVAFQLAENIATKVTVLHVIEEDLPIELGVDQGGTIGQVKQNKRELYILDLIKNTQLELAGFLQPQQRSFVEFDTVIEVGNYDDCLMGTIIENETDLVILGGKNDTVLTKLTIEGHEGQTYHRTFIPMLTVSRKVNLATVSSVGLFLDWEQPDKPLIALINLLSKLLHFRIVVLHDKEMGFVTDDQLLVHLRLLLREYGEEARDIHVINKQGPGIGNFPQIIKKYNLDLVAKKDIQSKCAVSLVFKDHLNESDYVPSESILVDAT